jgi:hypothetical protein
MIEMWAIAMLAVAAYCFARGIADLRQRRFVWGALGVLAGVIIVTMPIQSHAVKFDLLPPANPQG